MKILILASNPRKDLNLEGEIRHLQEVIERAKNREQLEVVVGFAVQPEDLQGLLLKHEPEIVHFCGHGTGQQGLVLQDDTQIEKLVSTDALSNLFELCSGWVKCVLLNACYSEVQANAIIQHIDYAIGMNHEIRDDAAIAFATGFYQALGYGQPIEQSYKFGRNAIQLQISDNSNFRSTLSEEERKFAVATTVERVVIPEHLKPVLKINPNLASNVDKSTSDASENLLPSTKLDIQSYIDKALEKEITFRQDREQFPESPTDNTIPLKKQPTRWWKSIKVIASSVATLIITVTGAIVVLNKSTTVSGKWKTEDFNVDGDNIITLIQDKDSPTDVTGKYFEDKNNDAEIETNIPYGKLTGKLTPTLDGQSLEGKWIETESVEKCESPFGDSLYWGKIVINFTKDLKEFEGHWQYCNKEPDQKFTGERVE